jgi:hypothetical protein
MARSRRSADNPVGRGVIRHGGHGTIGASEGKARGKLLEVDAVFGAVGGIYYPFQYVCPAVTGPALGATVADLEPVTDDLEIKPEGQTLVKLKPKKGPMPFSRKGSRWPYVKGAFLGMSSSCLDTLADKQQRT